MKLPCVRQASIILATTLLFMLSQSIFSQEANKDGSEFIAWPHGKLQLELTVKTISASSWCLDDIGKISSMFITATIEENSIEGNINSANEFPLKIKPSRLSFKSDVISANLSEDGKVIIFSGDLRDGSGRESYKNQELRLTKNLDIQGEINWNWEDPQGKCTGVDVITGVLNY